MIMFTKTSQKISTHHLTVLITGAIVHIEQRKREMRTKVPEFLPHLVLRKGLTSKCEGEIPYRDISMNRGLFRKGEMTYVNAEYFWRTICLMTFLDIHSEVTDGTEDL